jgi:peroxiredoxin
VDQLLVISSILLWIVVLINLGLTLMLLRRARVHAQPSFTTPEMPPFLTVGAPAPEFTAQTLSGDIVTRASYTGQPVTFLFISTDCSPCHDSLSRFVMTQTHAAGAGEACVLICDDDAANTQRLVNDYRITTPILVAPSQEGNTFLSDYNVAGTPFFCSIDAQGRVRASGYPSHGFPEWDALIASWTESQHDRTSAGDRGVGVRDQEQLSITIQ